MRCRLGDAGVLIWTRHHIYNIRLSLTYKSLSPPKQAKVPHFLHPPGTRNFNLLQEGLEDLGVHGNVLLG